jgi:hypothetical protein
VSGSLKQRRCQNVTVNVGIVREQASDAAVPDEV